MPKRRHILLGLAFGALVIGLYTILSGPPEPGYEGRTLGFWIKEYRKPGDVEKAATAIRHIGTNALPHLLKWIRYEEPAWKGKVRPVLFIRRRGNLITGEGWVPSRAHQGVPETMEAWMFWKASRTYDAEFAFRALGSDGNPAIPELVRLMRDPEKPDIANLARDALITLGTAEALSAAILAGPNDEPYFRGAVISRIGALGVNATSAIPALLMCLTDSNSSVRVLAAVELERIAPQALKNARRRIAAEALTNAIPR